jgi:hypothetical protein
MGRSVTRALTANSFTAAPGWRPGIGTTRSHVQRFLPAANCKDGLCTTALAVFSGDVVKRPELTQAVAASVAVGLDSETDAHLLISKGAEL